MHSTMISAQVFILLVMYSSLAAANYCNLDLKFYVVGEKHQDKPWQATGAIINSGSGTHDSEEGSWNVTVDVQQCSDRCETNPFTKITAEGIRNQFEPLSGYTLYPEIGSYKFHPDYVSWDVARETCVAEGAHLAILNSEEEAQFLGNLFIKILKPDAQQAFFVGVHDLYREGQFITILDQPLSSTGYSKWLPGEPNNRFGNENCVSMATNQGLNDINCNFTWTFFCEQEFIC